MRKIIAPPPKKPMEDGRDLSARFTHTRVLDTVHRCSDGNGTLDRDRELKISIFLRNEKGREPSDL